MSDKKASYIDVLIAKRSLFDAELALTETHRLHLVSVVQLYKALGGGWSPDYSTMRGHTLEVTSSDATVLKPIGMLPD